MNRSRLLMIGGLGLAVGLLVSFTVYNKLRAYTGANNERSVQVVVAADDIQVGSKLGDHDLRLAVLPQSSVPPNAYSRKSQVLGRGAVLPIGQGDFILPSKLAAEDAGSGLPSMIPPGMRAVSVRVNDVVSVAGFVQPGTRVDVLATGSEGNERQTTTVLENVAVIAVGRSLLDRIVTGETQNAPVITLLVSPDDAPENKKGASGATRESSLYPGKAPAATDAKPKTHKMVAKAAPPSQPLPYQVEMIRDRKSEEHTSELQSLRHLVCR